MNLSSDEDLRGLLLHVTGFESDVRRDFFERLARLREDEASGVIVKDMTQVGLQAPQPAAPFANQQIESEKLPQTQTTPSRRRRKKSGIQEEIDGKQGENAISDKETTSTITSTTITTAADTTSDESQRAFSDRGDRTDVNALNLTGATQSMSVAAVVSKLTSAQQAAAVVSSVLLKEMSKMSAFPDLSAGSGGSGGGGGGGGDSESRLVKPSLVRRQQQSQQASTGSATSSSSTAMETLGGRPPLIRQLSSSKMSTGLLPVVTANLAATITATSTSKNVSSDTKKDAATNGAVGTTASSATNAPTTTTLSSSSVAGGGSVKNSKVTKDSSKDADKVVPPDQLPQHQDLVQQLDQVTLQKDLPLEANLSSQEQQQQQQQKENLQETSDTNLIKNQLLAQQQKGENVRSSKVVSVPRLLSKQPIPAAPSMSEKGRGALSISLQRALASAVSDVPLGKQTSGLSGAGKSGISATQSGTSSSSSSSSSTATATGGSIQGGNSSSSLLNVIVYLPLTSNNKTVGKVRLRVPESASVTDVISEVLRVVKSQKTVTAITEWMVAPESRHYELRLHESGGMPDEDFPALDRTRAVKYFGEGGKYEYCLRVLPSASAAAAAAQIDAAAMTDTNGSSIRSISNAHTSLQLSVDARSGLTGASNKTSSNGEDKAQSQNLSFRVVLSDRKPQTTSESSMVASSNFLPPNTYLIPLELIHKNFRVADAIEYVGQLARINVFFDRHVLRIPATESNHSLTSLNISSLVVSKLCNVPGALLGPFQANFSSSSSSSSSSTSSSSSLNSKLWYELSPAALLLPLYVMGLTGCELQKKRFADTPPPLPFTQQQQLQQQQQQQSSTIQTQIVNEKLDKGISGTSLLVHSENSTEPQSSSLAQLHPHISATTTYLTPASAAAYEEFLVIKTNQRGKKQHRIMGIDMMRIKNALPGTNANATPTKAALGAAAWLSPLGLAALSGNVTTSERPVSSILRVNVPADSDKDFVIVFSDIYGSGEAVVEYEAATRDVRDAIVSKLAAVLRLCGAEKRINRVPSLK